MFNFLYINLWIDEISEVHRFMFLLSDKPLKGLLTFIILKGISAKSFDGRGNYNMGIKEQIIFPGIEYDKIDALRGMNITITTSAKTDDEAKGLLSAFSFPFRG